MPLPVSLRPAYPHLAAVAAIVVMVAVCACFDVEQSVVLRRDLTGSASVDMTLDSEPVVVMMAAAQHLMAGQTGNPTPAEIEASRREFLASEAEERTEKQRVQAENDAELKKSLPPGVKLVSSSETEQGTKTTVHLQFDFDDVKKLAQVHLPEKGVEVQKRHNPFLDPFHSLEVVDEGPTLLVTICRGNPMSWVQQELIQKSPDARSKMQAFGPALKSARFTFRLDSPFEVVEANAMRRDGRTLVWEIKGFDPEAKIPQTFTARLRK